MARVPSTTYEDRYRPEHDAADVTGLRHEAECLLGVGQIEHRVRQRFQRGPPRPLPRPARGGACPPPPVAPRGASRSSPWRTSDHGGTAASRAGRCARYPACRAPRTGRRVGGARCPRDRLTRERVENDVDALAACEPQYLVGECQRAGIHDVRGSDRRQVGALLVRRCGREDLCACARRASCTAASPTPPAAECTSTRSPACKRATCRSASRAVPNAAAWPPPRA